MNMENFIQFALTEDIGTGDHTSLACIDPTVESDAELIVKESGIIAGVELAEMICHYFDPEIVFKKLRDDGQIVNPGDRVFYLHGRSQNILQIERLILNFMQRMSGIASLTKKYTSIISDIPCKILDTRKTTPGFRYFEKWAVRIGGGNNHRYALYDMIMIKDNHVDYAGGIEKAIDRVQSYCQSNKLDLKIEIETRSLAELQKVINHGGVNRVMLDNYSIADLTKAIQMVNHRFETEASGGITLENIRQYAETGVNFISSGAITHSYKSLDLSLKAIKA